MTDTATVAPFGTYADVTGVVDATAAGEIVALIAVIKGLFNPPTATDLHQMAAPLFNQFNLAQQTAIRAELDGLAAAIAAAPTSAE